MILTNFRSTILTCLIAGFLVLSFSHCATDKEIETRSLNRFVSEGLYRNTVKGFSMKWPNDNFWKYNDTPEFDLGFDHINGKSQFFIVGVRGLIRRDFPQGFADWILEHLEARDIEFTGQEELEVDNGEFHKIFLKCTFMILPRDQFGVKRRACVYAMANEPFWVGVIYISPEDAFEVYLPNVDKIVETISFIKE